MTMIISTTMTMNCNKNNCQTSSSSSSSSNSSNMEKRASLTSHSTNMGWVVLGDLTGKTEPHYNQLQDNTKS